MSLFEKGISVKIIDIRKKSSSNIVKNAEDLGIRIYWNSTVVNTFGYKRIKSIEIMNLSEDGSNVTGTVSYTHLTLPTILLV